MLITVLITVFTCTNIIASGERQEDTSAIAFVSNRDGAPEIYIMSSDGEDVRRVTHNRVVDFFPCWSPDGSRIAFVSIQNGNSDIYVMDADGGKVTRLTTDPAEDTTPSWR